MPNRKKHNGIGGLVGLTTYVLLKKAQNEPVNGGMAVASAIAGAAVAGLPDDIEPANRWNHRGFAHSWTMAAGVAQATKQAWESPRINGEQKALLMAIGAAYLSHLFLDASTPESIPIL